MAGVFYQLKKMLLRKYCHIFLNAQLTMFGIWPPGLDKKAQNLDYLGLLTFSWYIYE